MTITALERDVQAAQSPQYADLEELARVQLELARRPSLVSPNEARRLTARLAKVARSEAFLLQAGDCAEPLWPSEASLMARQRLFLQMTMVLMYGANIPVVKVGRVAGQYWKPRSKPTERRLIEGQGWVEHPAYRGPGVNSPEFSAQARMADPGRLLEAHESAATTMNTLRMLMGGSFADLDQVHQWNMDFVRRGPAGQRYEALAHEIDAALAFIKACSPQLRESDVLRKAEFASSHECLSLPYERAQTRCDPVHPVEGELWDLSATMLWIGERTRQIDGAHVEFLSGVMNPIGVKLGPTTTVEEMLDLCRVLNPGHIPGRLTFIVRMGASQIRTVLPPLLEALRDYQATHAEVPFIAVVSDPMHGNTDDEAGVKTRQFDNIMAEIEGFFWSCAQAGVWPGGVHLELTGEDVTECLGGTVSPVLLHQLGDRYHTLCDPRLNAEQGLELAFLVAQMLRQLRP